ncbi:FecR family protein [Agriterribacter sp.]|uniref:FecR family protein n=1 Tax=Agriterribacter sp. TaxID=2821509 RepID=UPI002C4ECECF|nr:FecR domain-containing protein [Agriterribacter sp.]HTN05904.1 FecR domain-containing protein [Agriterribacter sp.]
MKHVPGYIQALIQKSLDGSITLQEKVVLDEWFYTFSPEDTTLFSEEMGKAVSERVKNRLNDYIAYERIVMRYKRQSMLLKVAVMASFISASSLLFYFGGKEKKLPAVAAAGAVKDISPGGTRAMLTLGDGSTIILDSSSNGQLGVQGNTRVVKMDNGLLHYQKQKSAADNSAIIYNTIATPRGGQYQVVLADGSVVWLNASSSLKFPAEFSDSLREVEITGEAYFEIARNASKPFRVKVKDMYVNVLGTSFNIMAYDDEATVNTTLLKGSLKISNAGNSKLIHPGQQVLLNNKGSFQLVPDADVEGAVAWKNGKFSFSSADIKTIMRQIERWYNVDVVFERKDDLHFTGELSRFVNVSQLLRKLELTNEVHFRIEKGRIIVLP